jgi:anti-sigma B factor antagonist
MPAEFTLSDEARDDRHVVSVGGEIDLFTAPDLKQRLLELIDSGQRHIVIDLSETTFLDSTALGVLIGALKRLRAHDGELVIVNRDQSIAKTFEITGLDQIFTIRPTIAEALDAFAPGNRVA